MTDRSKDEMADALARMLAGEVDPSDASHHGEPAGEAPAPPPPAAAPKSLAKPIAAPSKPAAPAAGKPSAPRPAGPAVARPPAPGQAAAPASKRPAAPGPTRPAAPVQQRPPDPAGRPAASAKPAPPVRPASPGTQRPAAPPVAPAAPAAPSRSARPTVPGVVRPAAAVPSRPSVPTVAEPPPILQPVPLTPSTTDAPAAESAPAQEDDDAVIVPAAPMEFLGHAPVIPHRHKARAQKFDLDSMKFRRTTIPIFFTSGVLLFLAGALRFVVGTDAPLSDLPVWLAFVAWGAAAVMIAGAIMNMLRVRNQLVGMESGKES